MYNYSRDWSRSPFCIFPLLFAVIKRALVNKMSSEPGTLVCLEEHLLKGPSLLAFPGKQELKARQKLPKSPLS